ncbi:MAG: peptidylprolyl isomerase [Aquabacterium sp.]|jgi:peptidyl-prolyl cis-trans isomerase C|nr:MAG: peptidylprolyl isomerase [Aquabacterium sp.]
MNKMKLALVATGAAVLLSNAALAQNIAVVNGKPVPQARVDALVSQVAKQAQPGQPPMTPEQKAELQKQARDQVVLREIFTQEAQRRGLQKSPDYLQQLELSRQGLLIRALFQDEEAKRKINDTDLKAEYDRLRAQADAKEYRARHILVETEDAAKKLIAQLKAGAKFEELAKKNSKDTGSAENGGDLDWAAPTNYVPAFSAAMVKLQKGQLTDEPVKTENGWHVIRLDDVRETQFPPYEDVKPQLEQRLKQVRSAEFVEDLKKKAKTDYKFSTEQH